MMKRLKTAAVIAAMGFAATANANLVQTTVTLLDTDPGSVRYVNFTVQVPGIFDISAQGADSLGLPYNSDPQIYLFNAPLSVDNFIVSDDDGGIGYDALISDIPLSIGQYILGLSQSGLSLDEAVSGSNTDSIDDPGPVRVSIESANGFAVPEPPLSALFAIGLAAFAVMRRTPVAPPPLLLDSHHDNSPVVSATQAPPSDSQFGDGKAGPGWYGVCVNR